MKFGVPVWLWLLPVLLAGALALFVWSHWRRRLALRAALNTPLLAQLTASLDLRRRWLKHGLGLLGLALLTLALARPQAGHEQLEVERTGIDLMIALDVSRSMLVRDVEATNRLDAARAAVRHLLHHLGGDRAGLVAFAGEAFLVVPLTRDHAAVERALDSLEPDLISEPGSDLAKAIERGRESFDRGSEGPHALLLISDGEQLQGAAAVAATEAGRHRVHVHAAGIGSHAGGTIPADRSVSSGRVKNAFGRDVVSRLDERTLRETARAGRGRYLHLEGRNSRQLTSWFDETAAGLPRTTERRQLGDPREFFGWPLALAILLLAAEWLARERRRAPAPLRKPDPILPLILVLTAMAPSAAQSEISNLKSQISSRQPEIHVGDPWAAYNRGVQAYASGDFQAADQAWLDLVNQPLPRKLRQPVWFQIGNAEFRLGEPLEATAPEQAVECWRRSRDAYRTVLAANRRHASARHNLALAERRLASLAQRLGRGLLEKSESQSLDDAISTLGVSVDYLREATQLLPADQPMAADRAAAERRLQQRLLERATQAENRGDQAVAQNNSWSNFQAEQSYRSALDDLGTALETRREPTSEPASSDAHPPAPSTPEAASPRPGDLEPELQTAQERVTQKLTQLLTRLGQEEQKSGESATSWSADEALNHFDQALQHYEAAQAVDPRNETAQRGEAQVRAAIEKLHVREGRQNLARGIQATPNNVPQAARELTAALGHAEAALDANPSSLDATELGDEARRRLPDVLARLGQRQQAAGERAEAQSPAAAVPRYEEAEMSYRDALDLDSRQAQARTGLNEVEERLARLRAQMAQSAQAQQAQSQASNQRPRSLQDLLGEVRQNDRNRERESDRRRQPGRRDTSPRHVYPNW